jgi:prepilin-type N-terminal cleavage/methylation domain-containing protein
MFRPAFTLLETVIVVTIIGLLTGVAIPRTRHMLDSIAVHAASDDVVSALELARHSAMTRGERVTVQVDTSMAAVTMLAGSDTLLRRNEKATHGVAFTASRPSVVYTQLGMGFGVSNLTLRVTRGAAAETVVVSRLGRVRR